MTRRCSARVHLIVRPALVNDLSSRRKIGEYFRTWKSGDSRGLAVNWINFDAVEHGLTIKSRTCSAEVEYIIPSLQFDDLTGDSFAIGVQAGIVVGGKDKDCQADFGLKENRYVGSDVGQVEQRQFYFVGLWSWNHGTVI